MNTIKSLLFGTGILLTAVGVSATELPEITVYKPAT